MIDAVLATGDARFYEHRALTPSASFVPRPSGPSPVQARARGQYHPSRWRNFFLSEKTLVRKIKEVFLAWRIEQNLTKDEILTLYLNKIPSVYPAFGVSAAAQVYFGREVKDLTLDRDRHHRGASQGPPY